MTSIFNRWLESGETILLDGAMGTMLFAAGLEMGEPPESWNLLHPERVSAVHRTYIEAGARIILTNTFGGNRFRLRPYSLKSQVMELNVAAARVARREAEVASHTVLVAGSIGPTGASLAEATPSLIEEATRAFMEQASALVEGGIDLLWIETMGDLAEVGAAIEGARAATDLPIVATFSFDAEGKTRGGVSPPEAVEALRQWGVAAAGANCGSVLDDTENAIRAMRAADPLLPLVAKANAGIPRLENGVLVYGSGPEAMATHARRVRDAGARLIGACCGATPAHIRAMARALDTSD